MTWVSSSMNVHDLLINRRISSLTTIAMRMVMCKSVMSKNIFRSKPVFFNENDHFKIRFEVSETIVIMY